MQEELPLSVTAFILLSCAVLRTDKSLPALREFSGMSNGQTTPAIAVLRNGGFIEPIYGPKGRMTLVPTELGWQHVMTSWAEYLHKPDAELETVIRLAWLAIVLGRNTTAWFGPAREFVDAAINLRRTTLSSIGPAEDEDDADEDRLALMNLQALRRISWQNRLQSELKTLGKLRHDLSRVISNTTSLPNAPIDPSTHGAEERTASKRRRTNRR